MTEKEYLKEEADRFLNLITLGQVVGLAQKACEEAARNKFEGFTKEERKKILTDSVDDEKEAGESVK